MRGTECMKRSKAPRRRDNSCFSGPLSGDPAETPGRASPGSREKIRRKQSKKKSSLSPPAGYLIAVAVAFGTAITAGAYILSHSIIMGAVMTALMIPFILKEAAGNYAKKRQEKIEKQFLAGMQAVLSALSAGGSVEQAFQGLYDDYVRGNGAEIGLIADDVYLINRNTMMHYSFYDELLLFAVKTESPDIISCVEAMAAVGRKGGDMTSVIRGALANLRIKLETDAEIRQTLSLPKYNQKIITAMPFALVLLVRSLSAEYAEVLYSTRAGTIVIWCVAAVIFAAWMLGRKLCAIEI